MGIKLPSLHMAIMYSHVSIIWLPFIFMFVTITDPTLRKLKFLIPTNANSCFDTSLSSASGVMS